MSFRGRTAEGGCVRRAEYTGSTMDRAEMGLRGPIFNCVEGPSGCACRAVAKLPLKSVPAPPENLKITCAHSNPAVRVALSARDQ